MSIEEELYKTVLLVCQAFKRDSMDLAHDVYLKIDPLKYSTIPICKRKAYVYLVARSVFLDEKRKDKGIIELIPEKILLDYAEDLKDYDYLSMIKDSPLTEIQKILVDLYLDSDGQYSEMARRVRITRQTMSKKMKEICKKLQQYQSDLD